MHDTIYFISPCITTVSAYWLRSAAAAGQRVREFIEMTHMPNALHRNHLPTVGTLACIQFSPPISAPSVPPCIAEKRKNWAVNLPVPLPSIVRIRFPAVGRARRRSRRNEPVIDGIIDGRNGENFSRRRFNRRRRRTITSQWRRRTGLALHLPAHSPGLKAPRASAPWMRWAERKATTSFPGSACRLPV